MHVKGDEPLYTSAAIFSPQDDSAKSKMSTGQGPFALLPPTRQLAQVPDPWQQHFWVERCGGDRNKWTGEGLEEPEPVWVAPVIKDLL